MAEQRGGIGQHRTHRRRNVFAVDVTNGTLSVQLRPPTGQANWSNLAAALTIRDSVGAVIASGGPGVPSGWTVDLASSVATGRYTIEVAPVGWLTASTGFTTYGSLGAYELAINVPQGIAPLAPGTSAFSPITPARLVDTRNGVGAVGGVGAGRQVVVQVADIVVPADANAAVVNVAAVNPSAPGYVTVYPCSATFPTHPRSTSWPARPWRTRPSPRCRRRGSCACGRTRRPTSSSTSPAG